MTWVAEVGVAVVCCAVGLTGPQQRRARQEPAASSAPASRSRVSQEQRELARARQLLEAGSIDQAIELLRLVVVREPDNADARLMLGTALTFVPEKSQALAELSAAVRMRPGFARGYWVLGSALARFADLDQARAMFEKAIELDPNLAEARVSLALLLAQRKEFALARAQLEAAIKTQKSSSAAYSRYLIAQTHLEEDDLEKALEEIDAATSLRPDYGEAYFSRGLIRKRLLDEAGAFEAFKGAAALLPNDPAAQYHLGASYLRRGEIEKAITCLRNSLELRPQHRQALFQLCRALNAAGRTKDAEACQQSLSAMAHGELDAADLRAGDLNNEGVELEKTGDLGGALEKYRAALKINTLNTVFRRNAGLVLCRLERWEEGVAELKEVVKADPEDVEATRALFIALERKKAAGKGDSINPKEQRKP